MMVRRSEMRGHYGKEVGCPQKQLTIKARNIVLLTVGRSYFYVNLCYSSLFGICGGIMVQVCVWVDVG